MSNEQLTLLVKTLVDSITANQPPPRPTTTETTVSQESRWKISEVGYFLPDTTSSTTSDIYVRDGDTYIKDVHLFIDRLKDMATIKEDHVVRTNSSQICLEQH